MATKVKLIADGVITPDQITLTTASTGTNTTAPATTAFVQQEISALVDSSPDALNTLNELAAALGDDANFSTTVTNSIATKLPLAGGTVTGVTTFTGGDGVVVQTSSDTFLQLKTTGSGSNYIEFKDSGGAAGNIRYNHSTNLLSVKTNGTDNRLVIDSSGKVGIGTDQPNQLLHLDNSTNTTDDAIIRILSGNAGLSGIYLGDPDYGSISRIRHDHSDNTLQFWSSNVAGTSSLQRMTIAPGGNIGIGITDPVARLDITGTTTNYPTVYDYLYATGEGIRVYGEESALDLVGQDTGGHSSSILLRNENEGFGIVNNPSSNSLLFRSFNATADDFSVHSSGTNVSNLTDILTLEKTGNVGIGTTDPDGNLEVITTESMSFASDTVNSITLGTSGTNKPCIKFDTADTTHTNRVWAIESGGGDRLNFFRNGLDVLKLNQDGSVEIPGSITNSSAGATVATFEGSYGTGGDVQLVRYERGGGAVYGAISYKDATTDMEFGNISSHALSFTTANTRRLTINNVGRIHIGTSNTFNAGLTVSNGDIRTSAAAFANDANTISMSYESSSTGGGLTVRGPNSSTRGKMFLSVNEGDGGNARSGIVIEPDGQVRMQYQPSFLIGTPNPAGAGNVWKSNTIFHNNGSHWNNTTGRFTAPVAGYYFFFHWGMLTAGQTTTDADLYSRLNGSRDQIGTAYSGHQGGNYLTFNANYIRYLNVNDYVDVYISSGTVYNNNDGRHGHFGGYLIG